MKRKWYAMPYLVWLILFSVVPLVFVGYFAFTTKSGDWTLANVQKIMQPMYLSVLGESIVIALECTVICLLVGYPTAYFLSFSKLKNKKLVLLLMILPMWSNSMLRIVSWLRLFSTDVFAAMNLLGSTGAVIAVTVTTYLPFMIFPIYTILEKLDRSCLEASRDLGVNAFKTFFKVTLPLSMEGVSSGVLMVFLPAATGFAISQTIGQGRVRLVGNLIQSVFEKNNYSFGSLLSLFVSVVILALVFVLTKIQSRKRGVAC